MATPKNYIAQTARGYVLVGFIFYILGAVGWLLGTIGSSVFMGGFMGSGMMGGYSAPFFPFFFPSVFFIVSAALTIWAWLTLNNIDASRYQDAQTASLVLGIFGIFFAWLIGGIFFLLAYGKLGDAIQHQQASATPPPEPSASPPSPRTEGGQFCPECGKAVSEGDKFCRNCGKQMA